MRRDILLTNAYDYIDKFNCNVYSSSLMDRLNPDMKKLTYICELKTAIKETEDICGISDLREKLAIVKYCLSYFDVEKKAMYYKEHIKESTVAIAHAKYYDFKYEMSFLEAEIDYLSDTIYVTVK